MGVITNLGNWIVTAEHVFILWEFQCRRTLITVLKKVQYYVHVCLKTTHLEFASQWDTVL